MVKGKIKNLSIKIYSGNKLYLYTVETSTEKYEKLSVYNEELSIQIGKTYEFEIYKLNGYKRIKSYKECESTFDSKDLADYIQANIKGVGEKTATKVVKLLEDIFPNENIYQKIVKNPDEIKKLALSDNIKTKLFDFFHNQSNNIATEIMELTGLSLLEANEYILNAQRRNIENVVEYLKAKPYSLHKFVRSIDFKISDDIAISKLGIDIASSERALEIFEYIIANHISQKGHTYIFKSKLKKYFEEFISLLESQFDFFYKELIESHKYTLMDVDDKIQFKSIAQNEALTAYKLRRFAQEHYAFYNIESLIENGSNIVLNATQRQAVKSVFENKVSIIQGGPGTGKTTIIDTILNVADKLKLSYTILAPTGKAANRVKSVTGRPATTIHKKLRHEFKSNNNQDYFIYKESNPLKEDLIIIEEASMIDAKIFYHLVCALDKQARLLLIGDVNQLPSVQFGAVLEDLILSDVFPITTLNQNFRQEKICSIKDNAHNMIHSNSFTFANNVIAYDMNWHQLSEVEFNQQVINKIKYLLFEAKNANLSAKVLSPNSDKQYSLSAPILNKELQSFFNPVNDNTEEISVHGTKLRVGDIVVQTKNNHELELYNGDEGVIRSIINESVTIEFDSGITHHFTKNELEAIELGYSYSIHKSQGSEYDIVILPINEENEYSILRTKLFYTALTRAKKYFVCVGKLDKLYNHIFKKENKRQTLLYHYLKIEFDSFPNADLFGDVEFDWDFD